jgi:CheY-like chemotaxis protein
MPSEKRLRVMVVDDQTAVCDVISDTIRYAGHEIVGTARDGVEAITRAEELRPDLVVMDILMPRMNGVDAMRAMLQAGTARRVMLISGEFRSTGMTLDELYQRGAAAFMEKPFDVNKLFDLLDQWCEEADDKRKSASKTS